MTSLADIQSVAGDSADDVGLLNSILQDEISAELAYRMLAESVAMREDENECLGLLRQLEEEHELAGAAIRAQIVELGGKTEDSAGSMGSWHKVVNGAQDVSPGGPTLSLRHLRQSEEHNLHDYEAGAARADPESSQLLRNLLIPAQHRHIRMLDELLGVCGNPPS